jgi:hypothetical protein
MKVWNQAGTSSPWTNGNDFFFTPGNRVQDLSCTYDAIGNITRIAKVVDYTLHLAVHERTSRAEAVRNFCTMPKSHFGSTPAIENSEANLRKGWKAEIRS